MFVCIRRKDPNFIWISERKKKKCERVENLFGRLLTLTKAQRTNVNPNLNQYQIIFQKKFKKIEINHYDLKALLKSAIKLSRYHRKLQF